MFDFSGLEKILPFVKKKPSKVKQILDTTVSIVKLTGGVGVFALGAYGAYSIAKLLARDRRRKNLDDVLAPLDNRVASGNDYEPSSRDCVDGEAHDYIETEVVCEDDGIAGDNDDAPPGLARRGPAARRIARRKKVVHTPYNGGTVNGAFLGHVVAQARNIYNGGPTDYYHRCLARSYMVRLLTEQRVRPAHINAHIDMMVCAVFHNTSLQYQALAMWKALDERQRMGGASSAAPADMKN